MGNKELKNYNEKLSSSWNDKATESNAQLFLSLAVDDRKQVLLFWNNAMGNDTLISTLKEIVSMLEKNKDKNFSSKNNLAD